MTTLLIIFGAAWRRWLGSERPAWAWPGYRATQVTLGIVIGALLLGADRAALACAALAVGYCTLPISFSRRPFEWVTQRVPLPSTEGLPHPFKTFLNGYAPWAEVLQGMAVFGAAAVARALMGVL